MRPVGPVLAVVVAALGLAAADVHLLGDRRTLVPPPDAVVEGFLRAVAMGREDQAVPHLSEELARTVAEDDLRKYGETISDGPGSVDEVEGELERIAGDRATATATCRSRTGVWRLRFELVREKNGLWRISRLEPPR